MPTDRTEPKTPFNGLPQGISLVRSFVWQDVSGPNTPVIGLVGGVGSGKSTLARNAAERRAWHVIDGDHIGHQLLEDDSIRQALRHRFGETVITAEGAVDRRALGTVVFGDSDEHRRALADLNGILHPRIRETISSTIDELRQRGDVEAILLDAAVMLEAGWNDCCDAIVFVDSPWTHRRERVSASRGWSEDQLRKRENSQLSLDEKRRAATAVVENDGSVTDAVDRLIAVVDRIRSEAESPS